MHISDDKILVASSVFGSALFAEGLYRYKNPLKGVKAVNLFLGPAMILGSLHSKYSLGYGSFTAITASLMVVQRNADNYFWTQRIQPYGLFSAFGFLFASLYCCNWYLRNHDRQSAELKYMKEKRARLETKRLSERALKYFQPNNLE